MRNLTSLILLALGAIGVYAVLRQLGIVKEGALDPASQNNIVNSYAQRVWTSITGDPNQTIGGSIYDTLNPQAGLASNEYSPMPGIIVTRANVPSVGSSAWAETEAADDAYWGTLLGGWAENDGGAVTGRIVSRGF